MLGALSCLVLAVTVVAAVDDEVTERQPRLFYVSSTTSTTTLTTATFCYVASLTTLQGPSTCGRRKKRSMTVVDPLNNQKEIKISPQRALQLESEQGDEKELDSGLDISEKEGRLLNYWMTQTIMTTFYSYTGTSSIAQLLTL